MSPRTKAEQSSEIKGHQDFLTLARKQAQDKGQPSYTPLPFHPFDTLVIVVIFLWWWVCLFVFQ